MMYPFMTLNDDTEITHSEMKPDGKVKVYIETLIILEVFTMLLAGFRNINGKILKDILKQKCPISNS